MKILKFGGTSMGSFESLQNVSDIIQINFENKIKQVVVCSAMFGTTNNLLKIGELSQKGAVELALKIFKEIRRNHYTIAEKFKVAETFKYSVEPVFEDLKNLIDGVSLLRELSSRSKAVLLAFGEKLSTRLLTEILKTQNIISIQKDSIFIKTVGDDFWEDDIDWEKTKNETEKTLSPIFKNGQVPIITGFFGENPEKEISLLGRGGSDFSASILAVSLGWKIVEIWTDVDGFLSADPRIVQETHVIPEIGYTEASELCSFGAEVLHPKTIRPVIEFGGVVWIKNTFAPDTVGTKIVKEMKRTKEAVLSITVKDVSVFTLDLFGIKMGVSRSEIYYKIFKICYEFQISIDMIASSETAVSFCLEESCGENEDFIKELKKVAPLKIENNKSILCIVSPSHVKGRVGIAAGFFEALNEVGVSAEMYSQNKEEVAQLVVVRKEDSEKGILAIHNQFTEKY